MTGAYTSGISQARTWVGWELLGQLYDMLAQALAVPATQGTCRRTWRPVSLDGSLLDVADEANTQARIIRARKPESTPGSPPCAPIPWVGSGAVAPLAIAAGKFVHDATSSACLLCS